LEDCLPRIVNYVDRSEQRERRRDASRGLCLLKATLLHVKVQLRHKPNALMIHGMALAAPVCMAPNITTWASVPSEDLAGRKKVGARPGSERLTVYLESNIKADARRLFHAITAAEYLETWICFPGHLPDCSTFATKINQDYMIAHLCEGIRRTIVAGRYLVSERRNVALSWRVSGIHEVTESHVDIRLSGNFEYTTLMLSHKGFDSWQQYLWHRSLWSLSLEKLRRLFDSLPQTYESSPARLRLHSPRA
jgi:hypothetical protein